MKLISKTSSALFVLIVILLISISYFFKEKEVVISNVKWNCGEKFCNVSEIDNKEPEYLSLNISIRAYKTKEIGMGYGAVGSDLVGEKTIYLNLYPAQISLINESIKFINRNKVELIVVNSWNIRKSENMH